MGEALKTSKRACIVRLYLGEKPHEAPRSEYCNSTHHPPTLDGMLVHHGIAHQYVAI